VSRTVISLIILAAVGLGLLAGSLAGTGGWKLYVLAAIGLIFLCALVFHFLDLRKNPGRAEGKLLPILAAGVAGIAATWASRTILGLDACVASGLVGLLAALFLPGNLAATAYAASFAGMSSSTILADLPMVFCTGVLVGVIFYLVQPVYEGFGGKLGTIAAAAVLATAFIFRILGGM